MAIILSNLNRFTDFFFAGIFLGKFVVTWLFEFSLLLACCQTTLRNITVRKQAINDKLLGSVATHLRHGGVRC